MARTKMTARKSTGGMFYTSPGPPSSPTYYHDRYFIFSSSGKNLRSYVMQDVQWAAKTAKKSQLAVKKTVSFKSFVIFFQA